MTDQEQVSMKLYVDTCTKGICDKLDALDKLMSQRDELHAMAIRKAEEAMLARLEGMNEFRAQIKEERSNYITKDSLKWVVAMIVIPTALAVFSLIQE